MRRAVDLARAADVVPNPNPRVGCVLLTADGAPVSEGFHRGSGTPHAEIAALAAAPAGAARGATAVVTLEPCNGTDRPGRCAQFLADAGVARVVFGQQDPNPAVAGGADSLRAAGVDVEGGLLAAECTELNPGWSVAVARGWPLVTWKLATSIDGRSAAADGTSRWITGAAARQDVQRLRAECDAILVGTGTALADDPRLTLRDAEDGPLPFERQPLRVVMGRRPLPPDARLRDATAPGLQLATHDPMEALGTLHERGIRHVWLEGGPTLAAAFVRAGLVDEVIAYVAPLLLGSGPAALGDAGITTLSQGLRLRPVDVTQVGDDVRLTLSRKD